jgi:glycosyltransferase involved in cell wall biosynthesis
MPLRVAVVHSFYSSRQPSGENAQVHAEVAALRRAGVDVRLVAARTDDLEGEPFYRLRSATRVATGRGRTPRAALDAFRPDLVHVHNLFPNFGRRWVEDVDVPVVATLHNFRTVCASGDLVRDGHLCTDCPDGRPWSAVRHRCYRGSVAATLPLALALWRGPRADPLLARADRVLCLSPRQRRMLVDAGLPAERLLDWTNFLPDALVPPPTPATFDGAGPTALFVGRLAAEKGGLELVRSWPASTALHVVGDGPQADEVQAASAGKDVRVTPQLARDDVLALMRRSGALVIPSAWPECLPLVFLEALACGLPVVVRRTCDLAAWVERQGLGTVVDDVADMAEAATALARGDRRAVAARCRRAFEEHFTEAAWVRRTLDLYSALTGAAPARPTTGAAAMT